MTAKILFLLAAITAATCSAHAGIIEDAKTTGDNVAELIIGGTYSEAKGDAEIAYMAHFSSDAALFVKIAENECIRKLDAAGEIPGK